VRLRERLAELAERCYLLGADPFPADDRDLGRRTAAGLDELVRRGVAADPTDAAPGQRGGDPPADEVVVTDERRVGGRRELVRSLRVLGGVGFRARDD
jgi:hypothetical protein